MVKHVFGCGGVAGDAHVGHVIVLVMSRPAQLPARARDLTLLQLATTQEGREICAGLKRAAQVSQRRAFCAQHVRDGVLQAQQHVAVAMGSLHGAVQQVPHTPPPPFFCCVTLVCREYSHAASPLQLMERAKMPAQGRPARSIDIVHL